MGRADTCDIVCEHPSISRFHVMIQHGKEGCSKSNFLMVDGVFVFDLGSTHGTKVNKTAIKAKCFERLRIGQMLKLGERYP
jgi:hypothetical protein